MKMFIVDDEELEEELHQWIDSYIIPTSIVEALEDAGIPLTLENGKALWLSFLESELYPGMRGATWGM